jgi:hypothetical protein
MANLQESDVNGTLFLDPDGNVVRLVSIISQPIGIVRDIRTGKQKQVTKQDFNSYRRLVPEKRTYLRKPEKPQLPILDTVVMTQDTKIKHEKPGNSEAKSETSGKSKNNSETSIKSKMESETPDNPKVKSEKSDKPKAKSVTISKPKIKSEIRPKSQSNLKTNNKSKVTQPMIPPMSFNEAVDKFWLKILDKKASIGNVSATGNTIQEAAVAVFNKVGIKCNIDQLREMVDKVPDSPGKKLIKSIIDVQKAAGH